nr:40S ribosomal protein S3 [Seculamonas ecuadoriensis]
MAEVRRISKQKKFVANGLFHAELNTFLRRELAEDGFSGCEVRVTPSRTEIIIRATRTDKVLGDKGRRIRELTSVVKKRFFPNGDVELFAERVFSRGLSAMAQCESLKFKLTQGLAVRRACYAVLRFVMESGAKGCEVSVAGKLRAQRAKTMKFREGYMLKTGNAVLEVVDTAVRHVYMRQGVLGVKVAIMLPPEAVQQKLGKTVMVESIVVRDPKEEAAVPAIPQVQTVNPLPKPAAPVSA